MVNNDNDQNDEKITTQPKSEKAFEKKVQPEKGEDVTAEEILEEARKKVEENKKKREEAAQQLKESEREETPDYSGEVSGIREEAEKALNKMDEQSEKKEE